MKKYYSLIHPIWIERFSIGGVYNGNFNFFIATDRNDYLQIRQLKYHPEHSHFNLSRYFDLGLLSKDIIERRISHSDSFIQELMSYADKSACVRKLTIELTQNCNLRCKYCYYTINEKTKVGKYHNNSRIDAAVAEKAIDEYFKRYNNIRCSVPLEIRSDFEKRNPPTISFYGGEVLLETELLKQLILYSISVAKTYDLDVMCSITTNGTLLNEGIISFLYTNNIYLIISLDGPQSENDKNRVYKDGSGSFEHINKWMLYMKHKYPGYLKKMVSIQAVDAPNYSQDKVVNFFEKKSDGIHFAGVNTFQFLEYYDYTENQAEVNLSEYQEGISETFSKCIIFFDTIPSTLDADAIKKILHMNPRIKEMLKFVYELDSKISDKPIKISDYFTSCYLGRAGLFVTTSGEYHMCERTDFSMSIGNVEDGIDNDRVHSLYKKYFTIMNSEECRSCWAGQFCPICIAQLVESGDVNKPSDNRCEQIRISFDFYLKLLVLLSNKYPHIYHAITNLFSNVNDITIDAFINDNK